MDNDMRTLHLANITDENAVKLYDALCTECEQQHGQLSTGAQQIIGDIAAMEATKRQLHADVAERGVVEHYRNGRQEFWRENKSIQAARALAEQQRKHLNELKLTPASQKISMSLIEDEFNNF